jgi:hypothetical protein
MFDGYRDRAGEPDALEFPNGQIVLLTRDSSPLHHLPRYSFRALGFATAFILGHSRFAVPEGNPTAEREPDAPLREALASSANSCERSGRRGKGA